MAVNGGHAGTKKGPNWGHVKKWSRILPILAKVLHSQSPKLLKSGVEKLTRSWDPAGLAWHGKRPKAENGKKMEIEMENGPKLDRGKNGPKNGPKMENNGKLPQKSIFFGPFFAPFQLGAVFHFDFHFFLHFRLLAVFHAIPARQHPKPGPAYRGF